MTTAPTPAYVAADASDGRGDGRRMFVDAIRANAEANPVADALCEGDTVVSYGELFERVDARASTLTTTAPGLVVVRLAPTVESIVDYLAAMTAGHVVAVAGADDPAPATRLAPDVVLPPPDGGHTTCGATDPGTRVEPHPDLALLLSTSGSTSSPKHVRLSGRAVLANAAAIADYLGIGPGDRGITSLPLHYTYGLSVLHSHLLAGASIVLTTASVVDPCCWRAIDRWGVTTLALVPHSLAMLEHGSPLDRPHRGLRAVTVAGGRLDPDRVVRWSERGAELGWELFVMYGQTEATARMSYLPPRDARRAPHTIGRAVPGGELTIDAEGAAGPDGATGEIVYRGPNVMMGYAQDRGDLARGHDLDELRTGDLGRFDPETGYVEIVGRASRFVKPLSIRVDLDQLERRLAAAGIDAACVGDDERIAVAATSTELDPVEVVAQQTGLPRGCCVAVSVTELPRTASGKVDYAAVAELAACAVEQHRERDDADSGIAQCLGDVLGVRDVGPDDSFVTLGGDSLSFVEVSIRLERLVGALPEGWHLMTVDELTRMTTARRAADRPTRGARTDTSILIRAVSILAVVATHMEVVRIPGGAHLMLAVAGYNFARFQLPIVDATQRFRAGVRTAARVGLPASVWIALNMIVVGGYSIGTVLLVNDYSGSSLRTDGRWRYWFFEAFVKIVLAATVLVAIPAVRRLERRAPYGFALGILVPLAAIRFELLQFGDPYNYGLRAHSVAWLFALGWLVHRSTSTSTRLVTTVIVVCSVHGFWGMVGRELFVMTGLLLLMWAREVVLPRRTVPVVGALAASSMWIYLFHPQIYPTLSDAIPIIPAYAATIVVTMLMGIVAARCSMAVESAIDRRRRPPRRRRRAASTAPPEVTGTLR